MYALDESTLAQATLPSGDVSEDALMVAKKETRRLDADPASWERVLAALMLPSNADYLLVRIDVGGDGAGGDDTWTISAWTSPAANRCPDGGRAWVSAIPECKGGIFSR